MPVVTGRSLVATTRGIVAASSPLAAQAGAQMLARGGHAVDAAIAANAVLGVVEPFMNGMGGDLFAMVYESGPDALHGLNASGPAPRGLSPAFLRSQGIHVMPSSGIHSVTVPGAVAGWAALHERFGRLGFAELLAPSRFYAEQGFPVGPTVAERWAAVQDAVSAEPASAATYLPGGKPPAAAAIFRNPDLAGSLRLVAEHGRDAFYRGAIAEAIAGLSRARGGAMTTGDLASFEPEWVTPVSTRYHGWTVYELPPNTQGIAALMMLDLMEQMPLGRFGFHSVDALHAMIEAKKLAYADMLRWVGDTRFAAAPVPALLDKRRAARRAASIDPARAAAHVEPDHLDGLTTGPGGDTVYLAAIDREGNIVSLIQSIFQGFGSGLVAPGTGFALQNRGALFTLEPGHPNELAPGKRPLHTIIPGFMRKGDVRIGFGIMGGFNQAQAHAQFVANVADFGLDIQQALEAGRFTKPTFSGLDVSSRKRFPPPPPRPRRARTRPDRGAAHAVTCSATGKR